MIRHSLRFLAMASCSDGKRKRIRRDWGTVKAQRSECFPPGPSSLADLGNWPSDIADMLAKGDEAARLRTHTNLLRKIMVTTDYSGFECPREALRCAVQGLNHIFGWSLSESDAFTWVSSCDNAPIPLEVLQEIHRKLDGGRADRGCIFRDILSKLPAVAQEWLACAQPDANATRAEKVRAHKEVATWLQANRNLALRQ